MRLSELKKLLFEYRSTSKEIEKIYILRIIWDECGQDGLEVFAEYLKVSPQSLYQKAEICTKQKIKNMNRRKRKKAHKKIGWATQVEKFSHKHAGLKKNKQLL